MKEDLLKECIENIKNSNTESFRILFDHFQNEIYHFIFYKIKDKDAAEDLLQDVFVRIWKKRESLQHATLKSYLYTIANNLALNYIRHHKIVQKYEASRQQEGEFVYSGKTLESEELSVYINKAIDGLSDKTREVFLMSRHQQLSYREIAERLNISLSTVESHMVKALKEIRNAIPKEYLIGYGGKK